MQVNTTQGIPEHIDRVWFLTRYGQNFPEFLDSKYNEVVDNAIDSVYTFFAGVGDLWSHLERNVYCDKTKMCYGLLVAWYLTDLYPTFAEGVVSSGGVPLKSKKIGGTQVTFADSSARYGAKNNADLLQSLKSNAFGAKAYMMIKSSGKLNFFIQY